MKKKNTRIRRRKYNSRKKYIFPLIALSILLVISVVGVFAASTGTEITDPDTGIIYKVTKEPDVIISGSMVQIEAPGEVEITGFDESWETSGDAKTLTITGTILHTEHFDDTEPALRNIKVYYKITSIADNAFAECPALNKIEFSENSNLTKMGKGAFKGSTQLENVDFTNATKLTSISDEAFSGCSGITSVILPASFTSIGESAFYSCVNLQSVDFSEGSALTSIGTNAFYNCPWLTVLENLPKDKDPDSGESTLSIGSDAFWGCCYLSEESFLEDPFDAASCVQNFGTELRGTSIVKIVPADGNGSTSLITPRRFFMGQEYKVSFAPSGGRTIVGLDLSADRNAAIPYAIDEKEFEKSADNLYAFEMPSSETVILYATATADGATEGAPTITTDSLPDGIKGKGYEDIKLEADTEIKEWSVSEPNKTDDGYTPGLPEGFALDKERGIIYLTGNTITADEGSYQFVVTADNGVSTHKKLLTLNIFDNELDTFKDGSLWWKESNGNISVAWTPLKASDDSPITYTIRIYDEEGNLAGEHSRTLAGTYYLESEFASIDVTDDIKEKGTYYFTITAESSSYGKSYANSSDTAKYPKGLYAYGYEKYTITATATGTGTGKITLSEASYKIPGIEPVSIGNGIEVTVMENAVTEATPLTFIFTPDKGCEATALTVDGTGVKGNKESYTFTSIGNTDSTATDGETESGTTGTAGRNHNVVVEFSLVSNSIGGEIVQQVNYVQGDKADFEAYGHNLDATGVVNGDTRWVPDYWWLDDAKRDSSTTTHNWTSDSYTDAIDTTNLSLGDHTLYVAFKQQKLTNGAWVNSTSSNATDVRSVEFTVTDKDGNTEDPDAPTDDGTTDDGTTDDGTTDDGTTDDGSSDGTTDDSSSDDKAAAGTTDSDGTSGGGTGSVVDKVTSALSGVDTSDNMVLGLWSALALFSLIGIGYCIRQMFRYA